MKNSTYDIIIIGAGPAGCSCAYQLRNEKLKIAVFDKASFPRDKICGDALSADVVNQFYRMDCKLGEGFEQTANKTPSHGVRFYSPTGTKLEIDFVNPQHGNAAGYIYPRVDFDLFWFNQIKDLPNIDCFLNEAVVDIAVSQHQVTLTTQKRSFTAKIVVGADGAYSIVNKKLGSIKVEKKHYYAGLRQYYENVTGFSAKNHIELHFIHDLLPGYFWIFPLTNGRANVGLGMLSNEIGKRNVNIKTVLAEIIETHPGIKDRFANATPLEKPKGYGLPIGSKKREISGDRFLLLGDAASLIDPLTGEGIANAMRSGRIAADHLINAINCNQFDATFNKNYDRVIYQKMGNELRISYTIQRLLRFPKLFNFVIRKANSNEAVKKLLTSMLDDIDIKKELLKPSFYFKLLFR